MEAEIRPVACSFLMVSILSLYSNKMRNVFDCALINMFYARHKHISLFSCPGPGFR